MRIQPNYLAVLNVSFFTATILFGIAACSNTQSVDQRDVNKDVSEIQNNIRFTDSSEANDASILEAAELINIHEIGLGRIGKNKSKEPAILLLSKMLTDVHAAASDTLKALADKKGISLPFSAEKNTDEGINNLVNEKNSTFDQRFVAVVIQYHNDAISTFEDAAAKTKDVDVKNYIAYILPTLKKHLQQAEELKKTIQ